MARRMGVMFSAAEPTRVVLSKDDIERLNLSGYREEGFGNEVRRIPDMNRADLANVRFGSLPAVTGHDSLFSTFIVPGSRDWKEFFATRKVVESVDCDGRKKVEVTSNLFDVLKPEEIIHQPLVQQAYELAVHGEPVFENTGSPSRKPRRYELVNVLTDSYTLDKFQFPEGLLNAIKFMAVAQPEQAAAKAQSFIRTRPGSENAVVVAGKFARSVTWAKQSVKANSLRFPETIAASDAIVIGKEILVYGPKDYPTHKPWFVSGPPKYLPEIMCLHRAVACAGTAPVMFAMGTECTVLNINIHNGASFESPTCYYHTGSHEDLPATSSPKTSSLLSFSGREQLEQYSSALEVVTVDGDDVATAVRISSRHVLVNAHVFPDGESVFVGGKEAQPVRLLTPDLWLFRCDSEIDVAWPMRDVEVGDSVAVCYKKGNKLQFSSPIAVRTTDGQSIVMSKSADLQPGMSGGAIVSLADFAFLGVYEGVGMLTSMASVFSQEMFTDVCTMDRKTEADRDEASGGEGSLYTRMKDRGLIKYLEIASDSLVPVYCDKQHVGMAYTTAGKVITACDPQRASLVLEGEQAPRVFDKFDAGLYKTEGYPGSSIAPLLTRKPNFGEEVFVVGRDAQGPYYSSRQARVMHIGISAKNFLVSSVNSADALPLIGGLIIAVSDAAVLGQYVRHTVSETFGQTGFCVALPVFNDASRHDSLLEELERIAPTLHPSTWEDGLLEEVFTHSSAQVYKSGRMFNNGMMPLAFVGDAALKVVLGMKLRENVVTTARWQTILQANMSNAALAAKAEEMGLVDLIVVGGGTKLMNGGKACADVLEALCGAVFISETTDVFTSFCEGLGLLAYD